MLRLIEVTGDKVLTKPDIRMISPISSPKVLRRHRVLSPL